MHLLYTKKYLSIQKHIIICVFTCLLFFSCTACGSHESLNVESKTHSSEEIGQKEQIINIETINSSNSESKKTEHITLTTNTSTTEFILNKKYDTIFISPKSHWYVETMEIPSRIVDAKTGALYKAERSFDIYRDELQREYFFLEGTAIQCGFKDKYVYGIHVDEKNFLTKDEIIELSDELVHKIKPDHNYTLISCEYYER